MDGIDLSLCTVQEAGSQMNMCSERMRFSVKVESCFFLSFECLLMR